MKKLIIVFSVLVTIMVVSIIIIFINIKKKDNFIEGYDRFQNGKESTININGVDIENYVTDIFIEHFNKYYNSTNINVTVDEHLYNGIDDIIDYMSAESVNEYDMFISNYGQPVKVYNGYMELGDYGCSCRLLLWSKDLYYIIDIS